MCLASLWNIGQGESVGWILTFSEITCDFCRAFSSVVVSVVSGAVSIIYVDGVWSGVGVCVGWRGDVRFGVGVGTGVGVGVGVDVGAGPEVGVQAITAEIKISVNRITISALLIKTSFSLP